MTDGCGSYQNALADLINGILKGEFLVSKPGNFDEAKQMVKESIRIYSQKIPHLILKYKTPDAVHQALFIT